MDDEMAAIMYKSGCRLVSIGVESGSQKMLDNIGKKITLDDIRNTVKILKKNKIKIYNYFVIGLPWETEETVEETIKFAIELDSNFISFYTATPLPGTKFLHMQCLIVWLKGIWISKVHITHRLLSHMSLAKKEFLNFTSSQ